MARRRNVKAQAKEAVPTKGSGKKKLGQGAAKRPKR